jgi:hypothetical protein
MSSFLRWVLLPLACLPYFASDNSKKGITANWPDGGPISILPREGKSKITKESAEKIAKSFLGEERRFSKSIPCFFTDNDFPFIKPNKLPCWLFEAQDFTVPSKLDKQTKPLVFPLFYVVVDSETGSFVEAFTPPKHAWWKNQKKSWEKTTRRNYRTGVRFLVGPKKLQKLR